MFAIRSARCIVPSARAFHASALRTAEKSAVEAALRDGLKTAMKGKDKPTVSVLKVCQAVQCCGRV